MKKAAVALERRETRRPLRQFSKAGPKIRWRNSQACRRGDERAAAHAAVNTNTVVGMTGRKAPITASTRLMQAIAKNSQRTAREEGGGPGSRGVAGLTADMKAVEMRAGYTRRRDASFSFAVCGRYHMRLSPGPLARLHHAHRRRAPSAFDLLIPDSRL